MGSVTLGDMAQFFLLRTNMNSIQKSLNDRVEELSTSEVADKTSTLGGNFTEFSAIEHSLSVGESFLSVINSAETFLSGPCCTNRGLSAVPLSPDGLILRPQ